MFRPATPADLARMSWYHRNKYEQRRRAYLATLETERPITHAQRDPLRAVIEALATELDSIGRATKRKTERPGKPELKPCGTVAAYRRHKRNGETPCPDCQTAERLRSAARRDAAKHARQHTNEEAA